MKPIDYDFYIQFLAALGLVVAGRDVIYNKGAVWYKRISLAGYLLISIATCGFLLSVWKNDALEVSQSLQNKHIDSVRVKKDNQAKVDRENDKKELEHNVDSALKAHNLIYNPMTKNVADAPLIYISTTSVSPLKHGELYDSIKYSITFCNASSSNISDLNVNGYVLVPYKLENQEVLHMFKNGILPKGGCSQYSNFSLRTHNALIDTDYIYIKGNYNNGKKTIDEILVIDGKTSQMSTAGVDMYDRIKKMMIKRHITD